MLIAFAILLGMELIGEAIRRSVGIAVPGPVIGLALLAIALAASPRLRGVVDPTATGLLQRLSLLFVPAAVGIVQHLPLLVSEGFAIGVAVVGSTAITLVATALTFRGMSRWLGVGEEG